MTDQGKQNFRAITVTLAFFIGIFLIIAGLILLFAGRLEPVERSAQLYEMIMGGGGLCLFTAAALASLRTTVLFSIILIVAYFTVQFYVSRSGLEGPSALQYEVKLWAVGLCIYLAAVLGLRWYKRQKSSIV